MKMGAMLNAYPDSIGGTLASTIKWLQNPAMEQVFDSFYLLPSMYTSDLDRGFSIISYDLNESLAKMDDLAALKSMGVSLKLDFVLNHASTQSPEFLDLIEKGDSSEYQDFFINWNKFWAGHGEMTEEGYILPHQNLLEKMHFRKLGLPLLMVAMWDGTKKPYWNTFYQEEQITCGKARYLGQMDLNINSPKVWDFYDKVLQKLTAYGGEIVRLDAFAYASKIPGRRNFLNEPETWDLLEKVHAMADKYSLRLLPEIHAEYRTKTHEQLAEKGYVTYDFFLPGLLIPAIEKHTSEYLLKWINEIIEKSMSTVNMLGCHDGIPLLDLRGLLPDEEIQSIIDIVVSRGGIVKDLSGSKATYYQVNATYFSALGECEQKMLLARAIQMFMPGIPQVWYLDLAGGKNDYDAAKGKDRHKEINRTNLSLDQMNACLQKPLTQKQLELLRFRKNQAAFNPDAQITASGEGQVLCIEWKYNGSFAKLEANLQDYTYVIQTTGGR